MKMRFVWQVRRLMAHCWDWRLSLCVFGLPLHSARSAWQVMLGDSQLFLCGRRRICWADSGTVSFCWGLAGASLMAVGQSPTSYMRILFFIPIGASWRCAFLLETS